MAQNRSKTVLDKVVNAIENFFDTTRIEEKQPAEKNGYVMTPLEKYGRGYRIEHTRKNEWQRDDLMYTEALVRSEYQIQRVFEITLPSEEAQHEHLDDEQKAQIAKETMEARRDKQLAKSKKNAEKLAKGKISEETYLKNEEKIRQKIQKIENSSKKPSGNS